MLMLSLGLAKTTCVSFSLCKSEYTFLKHIYPKALFVAIIHASKNIVLLHSFIHREYGIVSHCLKSVPLQMYYMSSANLVLFCFVFTSMHEESSSFLPWKVASPHIVTFKQKILPQLRYVTPECLQTIVIFRRR